MVSQMVWRRPLVVMSMASTMLRMRNRPQPRGLCAPSSFLSRSGSSAGALPACASPAWASPAGASPPRALMGTVSSSPALVADGDDDLVAVLADLDLDRDLGVVAVAVLDGVHGGLGHRGLELLQAGLGQAEVLHRAGHPGQREALVARLARQRERVEPAGLSCCSPGRLGHCDCSWCHAGGDR